MQAVQEGEWTCTTHCQWWNTTVTKRVETTPWKWTHRNHWSLRNKYGLDCSEKTYPHSPPSVDKYEQLKLVYSVTILIEKHLGGNHPDVTGAEYQLWMDPDRHWSTLGWEHCGRGPGKPTEIRRHTIENDRKCARLRICCSVLVLSKFSNK